MAVVTKPNRADPLDLIKSQKASVLDVFNWLQDARLEAMRERNLLKEQSPETQTYRDTERRMKLWYEAVDRLIEQYRLMSSG